MSRFKSFQTQVVEAHQEQARNEASAHSSGSGLELAFKGKGKAVEPAQAVQPETQLFDCEVFRSLHCPSRYLQPANAVPAAADSQLSAKVGLNPKETNFKETPLDSLAEPDTIEGSASIATCKKGGTAKEPAGKNVAPTRRSTRARTSFTADACECGAFPVLVRTTGTSGKGGLTHGVAGDKEEDGAMICCSSAFDPLNIPSDVCF